MPITAIHLVNPHLLTSFPCLTYSLRGVFGAISPKQTTLLKFFFSESASLTTQTKMGLTLGVGVGMSSETVESDVSAVPNQES